MSQYKVKLMFMYSDTVEVEAESQAEAISAALLEDFEEQFDCLHDTEVTEL